ncbi:hypothetical protein ACHAPU_002692 [Fusarium lateritium]
MSLSSYRVLFRGQMIPIKLTGRFGLGAYQDQMAYYRNVTLYDEHQNPVYKSSLTSDDILDEYGVKTNHFAACMDGPKRDRLICLGDYYHTSRIIGVSTSRFDLQRGTIESLIPTQNEEGLFSMSAPLGYQANATVFDDNYGLQDYQLLGLLSLYSYIQASNDLALLKENWTQFEKLVEWSVNTINKTDGLVHLTAGAFTGPTEAGSSVYCLTSQSLHSMAELARAIGKEKSAKRWSVIGDELGQAIQKSLWNEKLGVWKLSTSNETDFSVAGTAFCSTSGIATRTQATRSFKALDRLALGPGYLDNTRTDPDAPTASISPNTNGFLLPALFELGGIKRGAKLIDSLWGPMVDNIHTSSGASWEYVLHDGTPGLGLFTSLGHPWGGAATYTLTEWVAGFRLAKGIEGYGYRNWVVGPEGGIVMGLSRAHGRVLTAFGGPVEVVWEIKGEKYLEVVIYAPKKTSGVFILGDVRKVLCGKSPYKFTVAL